MKKFFIMILTSFLTFSLVAANPEEILEKARTQTSIKTMASDADINIQQPIGRTIEILKVRQYTGKDANGAQSSMIIFLGPAKHKGTRFLMIERKDGSNNQQVFLPSLGKSRRIAAEAEGNNSFFGTDFSYNDIAFMSRAINLDTHKFLPEENYKGVDCYVIESTPKNKKESYSKSISKIEKATNLLLCAEFYDKKGQAAKLIELLDYKNVDSIDTPMNVKMTTYSTSTATVISIKNIKYGLKIPPRVFTTRYLETGR
ncbi:MAG: outer membrane lipoprotein-sorting protein [Treponemataceae bacterium]